MFGLGYARAEANDLDGNMQLQAITNYCIGRGIELKGVFVDGLEDGRRPFTKRPAARKLMDALNEAKADCIVVYEINRLGRSVVDAVAVLVNLLERQRDGSNPALRVLSVNEEFMNTDNDEQRKVVLRVMSWFAQEERKRFRESQESAWRSGKQKGRPPLITRNELVQYVNRYPGLSMTALTKLLNSDRAKEGKKQVGYSTVRTLAKRSGIRWRLMVSEEEKNENAS